MNFNGAYKGEIVLEEPVTCRKMSEEELSKYQQTKQSNAKTPIHFNKHRHNKKK